MAGLFARSQGERGKWNVETAEWEVERESGKRQEEGTMEETEKEEKAKEKGGLSAIQVVLSRRKIFSE